jgi:large subunit ribosomal protein L13
MMRSYVPKAHEIQRNWLVVDASGQVLGRLATELARLLRGKHKPSFTPYLDTGDFVVVVNAERIKVTGDKLEEKKYFRQSGRPGSLKTETLKESLAKHPERVIEIAVKGMLPKNKLGKKILKKLKVYPGREHPHEAQQPTQYSL